MAKSFRKPSTTAHVKSKRRAKATKLAPVAGSKEETKGIRRIRRSRLRRKLED
jgi:hypothetical protein